MQDFENKMLTLLDLEDSVPLEKASVRQLYHAASKAAMSQAPPAGKKKRLPSGPAIFRLSFCLGGSFTAIC